MAPLVLVLLAKVVLGGVLFGLAGYVFAELSHTIRNYSKQRIGISKVGGLARHDQTLGEMRDKRIRIMKQWSKR
jgi:hypothetical protein